MNTELMILAATSVSIGFFHTLFGPDHYVPFIVMAKAGKWSFGKTTWITFLCGLGHIFSSIILGIAGILLGIAVHKLEAVESVRGNIPAWLLIAFGLVYFVWGVRRAIRNNPHTHWHTHGDGSRHIHEHTHLDEHTHVHAAEGKPNMTPWILFTIFVFGPCEPLIPLLMYPAAQQHFLDAAWVALVFGATTVLTMLGIVLISLFGINFLPMKQLERYTHAVAGASICLCGMAILFLGL